MMVIRHMAPTHIDDPFSIRELTLPKIVLPFCRFRGPYWSTDGQYCNPKHIIKWITERTCGFIIIISQRTEMLHRNFDTDVIGCLFDRRYPSDGITNTAAAEFRYCYCITDRQTGTDNVPFVLLDRGTCCTFLDMLQGENRWEKRLEKRIMN
jgi:hypothetical protein